LIRVLLVDDHRLVRAGLQSLLEACEDIEVVGSAADGREALDLVGRVEPDVVLMDLSMPGMAGSRRPAACSTSTPASRWWC
jgi:YesN/AraC family two-component response regulator